MVTATDEKKDTIPNAYGVREIFVETQPGLSPSCRPSVAHPSPICRPFVALLSRADLRPSLCEIEYISALLEFLDGDALN